MTTQLANAASLPPATTIAERRMQARIVSTGDSVKQAIQARLLAVFGIAKNDGTRYGPKTGKTHVMWPDLVTVEVDPFSLHKDAQKKDLLDPMFMAQLTRATGCTVYGMDSYPTLDGQLEMNGVWYVALLQPLPPALPAGPEPEVALPKRIVIDPYKHYPRDKASVPLWGMGYDGSRLLWVPFDRLSNALYSGTTQWGKSNAWMISLMTAMLNHGPEQLRVAMIDPKGNCSVWAEGAPHLMTEVCRGYDVDAAERVVQAVHDEVQRRKLVMGSIGSQNIERYNERVATESRLPYIIFVFEEVDGMLADSTSRRRSFYTFLHRVVKEGLAYGVRSILVLQKADAEAISTRLSSQCNTRVAVHCTTEPQFRVGMGEGLWALNSRLTVKGRAAAIVSGEGKARIVQMPYLDEEQLMAFTAHWRDGREPNEPVAIPVGTPLLSHNAKRLVAWSMEHTPGRMSRPALKASFEKGKTPDGGLNVAETEIREIQHMLSAQGLLSGGGRQGSRFRLTPRLEALVQSPRTIASNRVAETEARQGSATAPEEAGEPAQSAAMG